jgi:hypothetical protein
MWGYETKHAAHYDMMMRTSLEEPTALANRAELPVAAGSAAIR